jgi:hypothetical protein
MDDTLREYLSDHHAIADWPPPTAGLIHAPDAAGIDLEGWSLVRSRPLHIPQARDAWLALWKPLDRRGRVLLRVDLIDTAGPDAAREQLLGLLGEFESPLIQRYFQSPVGDIAFGPPDETAVVFLRANVVVALRNAEREVVPLVGPALYIDNQLRSQ